MSRKGNPRAIMGQTSTDFESSSKIERNLKAKKCNPEAKNIYEVNTGRTNNAKLGGNENAIVKADNIKADGNEADNGKSEGIGESFNVSDCFETSSVDAQKLKELRAVCEALIFVSDEPISTKTMADLLSESEELIESIVRNLARDYVQRQSGLQIRQIAGGWQIATRPEHHDYIRAYLKTLNKSKLSLAALETLAVIAYKQPITAAEIMQIRGVQSTSAIKTLLEKKLIVAKGRKETVGRPMTYGTSKEFLIQFGLKDLSELPSIEDFEDLAE
jgi:segregation and condensation protein B